MTILFSYWRNFSHNTFTIGAFETVGTAAEMYVRIWSFPNEPKYVLPSGVPCAGDFSLALSISKIFVYKPNFKQINILHGV